jgi:hypothetical protein
MPATQQDHGPQAREDRADRAEHRDADRQDRECRADTEALQDAPAEQRLQDEPGKPGDCVEGGKEGYQLFTVLVTHCSL